MKRVGNLYDKMFTEERLFDAYKKARRGKRKKRAVLEFERNLGANISALSKELKSETYQLQPYNEFTIYEPKKRIIYAPAFRDVVVQHDIYKEIYPIFNATFIDQSYACRVGYGTHKAALKAYKCILATQGLHYVQMDIRKFFYRIGRDILEGMFWRKIKDGRLIKLMRMFCHQETNVGIPIGNLLVQLYALIYLNPMDHFIKRVLGVDYYVRYADDFILFGYDKQTCKELKDTVQEYIHDNLRLELSRFTIKRVDDGINFAGYRMWPGKRLIRKRSMATFRKSFNNEKTESIVSILGHAFHTKTLMHMLHRLRYEKPLMFNRFPQKYLKLALEV